MAQPMMCDAEDGTPAVLLVTNLETGDANAWCPEHVPTFIRQMAEATGLLSAEYERGVNDTVAKHGAALAEAQSKEKGQKARKTTAAKDSGQAAESTPALVAELDDGHHEPLPGGGMPNAYYEESEK